MSLLDPHCPIHKTTAECVTGAVIYPHRPDLAMKRFWRCTETNCTMRVGCHPGGHVPLGYMCDARTRMMRIQAHDYFDKLWRGGAFEKRTHAYTWLAEKLGVKVQRCHIGQFNAEQCAQVIKLCQERA